MSSPVLGSVAVAAPPTGTALAAMIFVPAAAADDCPKEAVGLGAGDEGGLLDPPALASAVPPRGLLRKRLARPTAMRAPMLEIPASTTRRVRSAMTGSAPVSRRRAFVNHSSADSGPAPPSSSGVKAKAYARSAPVYHGDAFQLTVRNSD